MFQPENDFKVGDLPSSDVNEKNNFRQEKKLFKSVFDISEFIQLKITSFDV
jgi:hypothetical protein